MTATRALIADKRAVKLTFAADGRLWYLDGHGLPRPVSGDEADAGTSPLFAGRHLRVPGLARNARLLVRLHRAVADGFFPSLEVCSPLCCRDVSQRDDPALLLYRSRDMDVPASAGGWHRFDDADLATYRLATLPAADAAEEVTRHPAWPALSFVSGVDRAAVAALLTHLLDPRWFVSPHHPDGDTKMPQFLGLDPTCQASPRPTSPRQLRNRTVLRCWRGDPPAAATEPGQFLWRLWYSRGGGPRGDLAASKRFVAFLRQVWLAVLAAPAQRDRLFAPRLFFADAATADAFVGHMRRTTAVGDEAVDV